MTDILEEVEEVVEDELLEESEDLNGSDETIKPDEVVENLVPEIKHYYYAQINSDGICCGISDTTSETTDPNLISIDSFDESYMGKLWDGEAWHEREVEEPTPIYSPTKTDIMELQLTQMEAIAEMYEQSESNRLNDMEVQAMIYETLLELQGA